MFSVALIGPDGAGKTTVSRRLERTLPLPVRYVYMGINLASSNVLLPTSWVIVSLRRALGRTPVSGDTKARQVQDETNRSKVRNAKRAVAWLRSYLRLVNLLAEETFRHCLVWYYEKRGNIVLLDRWFFADFCASSATDKQPTSRRIHGYLMEHFYPKPDLVIYLDAPAEVLFARKRESSLEVIEWRRQKYLQLRDKVKNFSVVDASQPESRVVQEVMALINSFYKDRADCRKAQMLYETGGH